MLEGEGLYERIDVLGASSKMCPSLLLHTRPFLFWQALCLRSKDCPHPIFWSCCRRNRPSSVGRYNRNDQARVCQRVCHLYHQCLCQVRRVPAQPRASQALRGGVSAAPTGSRPRALACSSQAWTSVSSTWKPCLDHQECWRGHCPASRLLHRAARSMGII